MVFALETYCPAEDGRSAARIEEEVVVTERRAAGAHALPGRRAADRRQDLRPRRGLPAPPHGNGSGRAPPATRRRRASRQDRTHGAAHADQGRDRRSRSTRSSATSPRGEVLIEDGDDRRRRRRTSASSDAAGDRRDRLPRAARASIDTHRHTWQALFRNIASDWTLAHYFTGLHGTLSGLYRPAGHLRGEPDRHARGARLGDHDAARLVAQPQHARAHRRRGRRARRDAGARRLRPRRRPPPLAAGQRAAAPGRGRAPPARGAAVRPTTRS